MLTLQRASQGRRSGRSIGLALAGGGPLGAFYELGALHALSEAVDGLDLTALDVYVGVSSGSIVAAALANGFDTTTMDRYLLLTIRAAIRSRRVYLFVQLSLNIWRARSGCRRYLAAPCVITPAILSMRFGRGQWAH
ncbi:MAG: patatin-like phospholipase family protein [Proteobacteria bacterium]|nr:patatin-like phospholipase family protein [Pseudomonadota bacterium]